MFRHREIRIYMPNITDTSQVAALKDNKPFLMKLDLLVDSHFLGVVAIPSLIDMLGFSGGGGPPGYAFAIDPKQQATNRVLFAAVLPNKELPVLESGIASYQPLGVAQAVGILYGHFLLTGPGVRDGTIEELLTTEGGLILDMIQYEPPPLLRTLYDPKIQQALAGSIQEVVKNAQVQNKP